MFQCCPSFSRVRQKIISDVIACGTSIITSRTFSISGLKTIKGIGNEWPSSGFRPFYKFLISINCRLPSIVGTCTSNTTASTGGVVELRVFEHE